QYHLLFLFLSPRRAPRRPLFPYTTLFRSLAARPSMGKTALALNFVETAIFTQSKPVLVFSMEMPSAALVMRMMSSVGRIDQGKIDRKSTRLNSSHVKISYAVFCLKKKKIY